MLFAIKVRCSHRFLCPAKNVRNSSLASQGVREFRRCGLHADGAGIVKTARRKTQQHDRLCDQHCVLASGCFSMIKCLALMMLSCLHFGQKSGNAFSSVSGRSCKRVFAPHSGHRTHRFSASISFIMLLLTFYSRIQPWQ